MKLARKIRLEKIWQSDTTFLKGPESVLFDVASKTLYVSSMGAGTVVRMDTDGRPLQESWVAGLNSNKGSAFYRDKFITAETAAVAIVDSKTATVVKRIPVPGAVMLNDIAVDSRGVIYVTDTRAGKLYRIENDQAILLLENLPGANGLLSVDSDLYVATATEFLKVDDKKQVTKLADGFESGLDGIVMLDDGSFILSNYKGMLYHVRADGTKEVLLDSRAQGIMANDIGFDSNTKTLYVPNYSTNQVTAYKVVVE